MKGASESCILLEKGLITAVSMVSRSFDRFLSRWKLEDERDGAATR